MTILFLYFIYEDSLVSVYLLYCVSPFVLSPQGWFVKTLVHALLCLVAWSCLTLLPHEPQTSRLLCLWGFFRQEYWSGLPCPPPGHPPSPGLKPRSPELQVDFLLSEPPEKPKNTGVSSLSLLQGIFLTQESNQGLLHCRWILYQLSYQGSLCCTQQYCVQILYCYTYYSFINIFSVFSLGFFVYLSLIEG